MSSDMDGLEMAYMYMAFNTTLSSIFHWRFLVIFSLCETAEWCMDSIHHSAVGRKIFEFSNEKYLSSVHQYEKLESGIWDLQCTHIPLWMKVVVLIIYPIRPLVKYGKGPHIPFVNQKYETDIQLVSLVEYQFHIFDPLMEYGVLCHIPLVDGWDI